MIGSPICIYLCILCVYNLIWMNKYIYLHKCWRSIINGFIVQYNFKIENCWCYWHCIADQIFSYNYYCNASRSEIFLRTTINYAKLKILNVFFSVGTKYARIFFLIYENSTLDTSNGLEKIFDDISTTNGTLFVFGMDGNSTPTVFIRGT